MELYREGDRERLLVEPVDVTVGAAGVYIIDTCRSDPGRIYQVEAGGSLTEVRTEDPILQPIGIATDPVTEDLFVVDDSNGRLVRVTPSTGAVSDMITGLSIGQSKDRGWACVDVTPDGSQMFVTDSGGNALFTFTRHEK